MVRSKGIQATSSYLSSCTCRDKQMTFGRTTHVFFQEVFKRSRVFITPIIRPSMAPVWMARLSTTLASPLPVIIPELQPPVQILDPPVQILHPPVQIPVPPVQIPVPPMQIPDPPVQLFLPDPPQPPVQIILPDPPVQLPPVVDTLEPNLKHDSSIDHIMLSIFGDIT
ncbi:hypothetical protein TNCV_3850041 [Trichonephila clavipes]|nr:hypothetical protein TNCV_3850041 [Trichonephila clavipes]